MVINSWECLSKLNLFVEQSYHLLNTPLVKETYLNNLALGTYHKHDRSNGIKRSTSTASLMQLNRSQSHDFAQIHSSGSLGKKFISM